MARQRGVENFRHALANALHHGGLRQTDGKKMQAARLAQKRAKPISFTDAFAQVMAQNDQKRGGAPSISGLGKCFANPSCLKRRSC